MQVRLSEILGRGFWESHGKIKHGCDEIIEMGGRGSGKSSFASIEMVLFLLKHPACHGVALRKVAATLRSSVYAQLLWAVDTLGLGSRFKATLSPLELEYLPTGQKILFFGMDDPGKLKSVKVAKGYIGVGWFEELDQFTAEEVRSAEQSLFRGGEKHLCIKSFNPPAEKQHWVNRLEEKQGRFCHHSSYLELPEQWLGSKFLADAEHLRRTRPEVYEHEYLGRCVGLGNAVFPNLRLERISDTQIAQFDRLYAGVDWGWWPDPWAFNKMHYDAARRTLYIFDEATRYRTPNRDTAALAAKKAGSLLIIADSAEAKSIDDYRSLGLRCVAAEKGPGSVEYSMKWLQSLVAIVIDPVRCPDTAAEFQGYEFLRDGDAVLGYPDRDNHHIDAVRYGLNRVWSRRGM
ncbi:MAG: phage terminase large subunit [Oscillospiraceae bacterium]|nr:phage terminase large subunit [Oscillospiraceae bacterium]